MLSNIFAPKQSVHGVLVEVFGIGVLITGDSGVGKSETALALIERKHRLVADDLVEIRRVSGNILMGTGHRRDRSHHMEIRGLGIINITHLFGVGAIRDKKQIQMAVQVWKTGTRKELRPHRRRRELHGNTGRPGTLPGDPRQAGAQHPRSSSRPPP